MSASLEVTISVKKDGVAVDGFPMTRRIEVDESVSFEHEEADGGGYVTLPTGELDEINALLVRVDQQVTIRLDAQTDAGIVLNAGGMLFILDADIDAGSTTNATISNASGSTVNIRGLAAGT